MSAIKSFAEDVYYYWKDGMTIEDISKKQNVNEATIRQIVEFMKDIMEES